MSWSDDEKADGVVAGMVATSVAMAAAPTVNTLAWIGAMGAGVAGIGVVYGVQLSKDESWKLVREFMKGAGLAAGAVFAGSKILSVALMTTGIGYAGAVALDATIASANAYAIGMASKYYFKNDQDLAAAKHEFKRTWKVRMA